MALFMRFILTFLTVFLLHANAMGQNVITIGDSTKAINSEEVSLTGTVTDSISGEKLPGVNVVIPSLNKGTTTDSLGIYTLSLKPGEYQLQFKFISRQMVTRRIRLYSSGNLNIAMREKPFELDEIIVQENQSEDNVLSVIPGIENLSISEIEEIPAFLGEVDIVNSLKSLPGVSTVGEGAAGLNIRGGRVDQNLI